MDDRELLELAAKAHGKISFDRFRLADVFLEFREDGMHHWNPLTDDGDALRLAEKLGLILCTEPRSVYAHTIKALGIEAYASQGGPDHMSNIRRAITRAAAEIGKSMP